MLVKELKKKLKGAYTDCEIHPFDNKDASPYSLLGKNFLKISGKKRQKWLETREVIDYEIVDMGNVIVFDSSLKPKRTYEGKMLQIYIKE